MYKLPHWCITDLRPSFYDTESATAIEQTARLYKAMSDLIEEYNTFADSTNKIIEDFINGTTKDYDTFKLEIAQQFEDFIGVVELKLGAQDKEIQDAIDYMKNNLEPTITKLIQDMKESGELGEEILKALDDTNERVDELNSNLKDKLDSDNPNITGTLWSKNITTGNGQLINSAGETVIMGNQTVDLHLQSKNVNISLDEIKNTGNIYIQHLGSSNSTVDEVVNFTIPTDAKYIDFTLMLEQYGIIIDYKRIPVYSLVDDTNIKQVLLSAYSDGTERYGLYKKNGSTIMVNDPSLRLYISATK